MALLLGVSGAGQSAVGQSAYSMYPSPTTPGEYRATTNGNCTGCQVQNPERAADMSATTAATLSVPLAVGTNYLNLRLRLTATVPGGSVAGVVVGSNRPLDLVSLSRVRLRTYRGTGNNPTLIESRNNINAVELKLIGANVYVIEFRTTAGAAFDFNQVQISLGALTDALSTLDVHYAYGVPIGSTPIGPAFTSTFAAPVAGTDYAEYSTGICVLCDVTQPSRAADENLAENNYATIQTTVGALGDTRLRLRLEGEAPAGSVAGLVISTGSLIDVSLLSTLTIRTYGRDANGNPVLRETAAGASLIQLNLLTGNRYSIGFVSTQPFEYVELAVGGLLTVANTVQVYYAFGAPSPGLVLPVTLTSFEARAVSTATVRLSWATASEKNSAAFVVERATDPRGAGGFVAIGDPVAAAGTSTTPRRYELLDGRAPGGTVYYRLRQEDTDGTVAYSEVVTVRVGAPTGDTPTLTCWPNPAQGRLTVRWAGTAATDAPAAAADRLHLYDGTGRLVRTAVLAPASDTTLDVAGLRPGRYVARVGATTQAVVVE